MVSLGKLALSVWCVTWLFPVVTSTACSQPLHYDEGKLEKFIFVSQQLRGQMARLRSNILDDVTTRNADIDEAEAELSSGLADAMEIKDEAVARAVNITSYMKMNIAPALSVWCAFTYDNTNEPFLTDVRVQHGISYDVAKGEATVPIKGVYQVEYKVQTYSWNRVKVYFSLYSPTGARLKHKSEDWSYSCAVMMRTFDLEPGSRIRISNLQSYYSWWTLHTWYLRWGFKTQLMIRYFGPGS